MAETTAAVMTVRYAAEGFERTFGPEEHILGADGIFLPTHTPLERSSVLAFQIRSFAGGPPLEGVVMVRWSRPDADATDDRPAGMAVKFVHFDDPRAAHELLGSLRLAASRARSREVVRAAAPRERDPLGPTSVRAEHRELEPPLVALRRARVLFAVAAALMLVAFGVVGRAVFEGSSSASTSHPEVRMHAARIVASRAALELARMQVAAAVDAPPHIQPPRPAPSAEAAPSASSFDEPEHSQRAAAPVQPAAPPPPQAEDPYGAARPAPAPRPAAEPQPYD